MMKQIQSRFESLRRAHSDERGVSFMMVMILTLMVGALGVAALTMTGLENSMAGAMRMVEEGTDAAESCIGMGVKVIQQSIGDGVVPAQLIAPAGPVPATNAVILGQEINYTANSPDVAWGAGAVPNIVMNVNNYTVNGDIDKQFVKIRAGSGNEGGAQAATTDLFYRVDCQAVNAATGTTSRVIAVYQCLRAAGGDTCTPRFL
jgi:Tfp pilus assembly protein PilX